MRRPNKDTLLKESQRLNQLTYINWVNRLTEISLSVFEWENLPDTVDERFLELALFSNGEAVFFRDEVIGYLALMVRLSGDIDVYGVPTQNEAYGMNTYRHPVDPSNSVIIYNNYQRSPDKPVVNMYARRLYEIDRAIDVNVRGQKTPKIITSTENQRLTLENLYMQYDGNIPFIFGNKQLDFQALASIDTTTPYVSDKLFTLRRQVYNDFLTHRGIENNNTEKQERQVTSEAIANIGVIQAERDTHLNMRLDAAKKINKMFGLNIHPKYRNQLSVERLEAMASQGEKIGSSNDVTQKGEQ